MAISRETDDYIRESIEHSLGLPVSAATLQSKLHASEQSIIRLRNQCLFVQSKLKEKDDIIESARAEASMNAAALKKFVEENQRLAMECSNLLAQCKRWERECSLYDRDREALMDFGNEADQRAKEAEIRVQELEEEVHQLGEELRFYKCEPHQVDTSGEDTSIGQVLLESLLSSIMSKDEVESKARAFLEANSNVEVCQKSLKMWNRLEPSTIKFLALAAEAKTLQKDKEHLLINLHRAEEEVKVLFEENNMLDAENKRIMQLYQKEKHSCSSGSGGKNSGCTSAMGNKRKSRSKANSSIERKIDFSNGDSLRLPLSPLRENSPECRAHKK